MGVIFNVFLYGIMMTQTYLYFNVYRKYVLAASAAVRSLMACQGPTVDEVFREYMDARRSSLSRTQECH